MIASKDIMERTERGEGGREGLRVGCKRVNKERDMSVIVCRRIIFLKRLLVQM